MMVPASFRHVRTSDLYWYEKPEGDGYTVL